ncbi:MAG: rhomboid family intramembrane serine protease [Phycisphaeraceae bacterium]
MIDQAGSDDRKTIPTLGESIVVRWLIGLCLILHALNALLTAQVTSPGGATQQVGLLTMWGNFNVVQGINGWQIWRLITYQFLHGNLLHLGMNMMALYVFGPLIEKWWGPRRFLGFYLLCGACGAWLMAMFAFFPSVINGGSAWLVGASGSIFGVLVASAMLYPRDEIKLLIPPIWVTVRTLAALFIGLSIVSMFIGWNTGGNAAHLGGALFGYLLVKRPWSLDFLDPATPKREPASEGDA